MRSWCLAAALLAASLVPVPGALAQHVGGQHAAGTNRNLAQDCEQHWLSLPSRERHIGYARFTKDCLAGKVNVAQNCGAPPRLGNAQDADTLCGKEWMTRVNSGHVCGQSYQGFLSECRRKPDERGNDRNAGPPPGPLDGNGGGL